MIRLVALATVAALLWPQVGATQGFRACGERDAIVERLGTKYGEQPAGMGLSHNNSMVEVFASEETGTWTIIMTMPSGQTCLVAAGEYWEKAPLPVAGGGDL